MKFRRKFCIAILSVLVLLLLYGWTTSTRHIDMKFLEEGVPLSECELHIISNSKGGLPETLHLGRNGGVRIPETYVGQKAIYAIKRGDDIIHSVYESAFERGHTSVDFRLGGIESTHRYRFLFYDSTTVSKSTNLKRAESESPSRN